MRKFSLLQKNIKFDRSGLIPAVIQDDRTAQVLMVAYMNRQALKKTLETGQTYFWSRSRKRLWRKGETSGHVQIVRQIFLDCDGDTLLIKVKQLKAACHTGYYTCFYRKLSHKNTEFKIVGKKVFNPEQTYRRTDE